MNSKSKQWKAEWNLQDPNKYYLFEEALQDIGKYIDLNQIFKISYFQRTISFLVFSFWVWECLPSALIVLFDVMKPFPVECFTAVIHPLCRIQPHSRKENKVNRLLQLGTGPTKYVSSVNRLLSTSKRIKEQTF